MPPVAFKSFSRLHFSLEPTRRSTKEEAKKQPWSPDKESKRRVPHYHVAPFYRIATGLVKVLRFRGDF